MARAGSEDELALALVQTAAELATVIDLAEQLAPHTRQLLGLCGDLPILERRRIRTLASTLEDWSIGARHQAGEHLRARLLAEQVDDQLTL